MTDAIRLERRDEVAIIWFDQPGQPVNTLTPDLLGAFGRLLDELEADSAATALILASGKPAGFIAGADIKLLEQVDDPDQIAGFSREGNQLLSRLANSRLTTVAAIHGPAMGGGLEVALACDYRVISDSAGTRLALPEVKLGLLPAGGGTQRLPRLIGLPAALDLMLTGRNVYPGQARRMGLADVVTHSCGLIDAALAVARAKKPRKPLPARERLILSVAPLRDFVIRKARERVMKQSRGLYPAPLRILDVVHAGLAAGVERGLAAEADAFAALHQTPESRALIGLFFAMQEAKRETPQARDALRIGVLGAGLMGSGIAEVSVDQGYEVVLRDLSDDALAGARRNVWQALQRKVRRGAMLPFDRDRVMGRLHTTTDAQTLARSDLVVEAVFEDLDLKHRVLAEVEALVSPDCIIASNTSALPIADIAAPARHPQRIIGMHYFSPVPKMPLLEIVTTDANPPAVIETARAVGQRQGKTVIVVRDGPGFYTTRVLAAMLNEVLELLAEGARIEALDRALKDWGFPVGAVTLMDEVGLDVGAHVRRGALGRMFAERGVQGHDGLNRMVEAGLKGRKSDAGFYHYPARGRKRVNESAYQWFGGSERRDVDADEIQQRVGLMFVNEAIRCLDEGIIASPIDGDLGAVLGLGFPPQRGGPFRWLDELGPAEALARLKNLHDRLGPRFEPASLLVQHAARHRPFHETPS